MSAGRFIKSNEKRHKINIFKVGSKYIRALVRCFHGRLSAGFCLINENNQMDSETKILGLRFSTNTQH